MVISSWSSPSGQNGNSSNSAGDLGFCTRSNSRTCRRGRRLSVSKITSNETLQLPRVWLMGVMVIFSWNVGTPPGRSTWPPRGGNKGELLPLTSSNRPLHHRDRTRYGLIRRSKACHHMPYPKNMAVFLIRVTNNHKCIYPKVEPSGNI